MHNLLLLYVQLRLAIQLLQMLLHRANAVVGHKGELLTTTLQFRQCLR